MDDGRVLTYSAKQKIYTGLTVAGGALLAGGVTYLTTKAGCPLVPAGVATVVGAGITYGITKLVPSIKKHWKGIVATGCALAALTAGALALKNVDCGFDLSAFKKCPQCVEYHDNHHKDDQNLFLTIINNITCNHNDHKHDDHDHKHHHEEEEETTTTTKPTEPEETKPTEPEETKPTDPKPTDPKPTDPKPTDPEEEDKDIGIETQPRPEDQEEEETTKPTTPPTTQPSHKEEDETTKPTTPPTTQPDEEHKKDQEIGMGPIGGPGFSIDENGLPVQ